MIRRSRDLLVVEAPISTYVIEPIRHDLGLTRAQMVDYHLACLIKDRRQYGADSNSLLEARPQLAELDEIDRLRLECNAAGMTAGEFAALLPERLHATYWDSRIAQYVRENDIDPDEETPCTACS